MKYSSSEIVAEWSTNLYAKRQTLLQNKFPPLSCAVSGIKNLHHSTCIEMLHMHTLARGLTVLEL